MKRLFLIITVFLICFYCSLWAQLPMAFHNVLIPETSVVYCMKKDDKGLLWIGTGAGLYCYDGYRSYQRNGYHTAAPQGVHTIHVEHSIIYLGCDNGFYTYNMESSEYDCLISDIEEVKVALPYGNKFYIGCKQGLLVLDKKTCKAEHVNTELKYVYSIAECGEGLLVGTLQGLYFVKDGKSFKRTYSNFVDVIMPDTAPGYYWIGSERNLFYYHANTDSSQPVMDLSGNYVKSLALDSHQRLYIGTDNGLYVKKGNDIRLIQHDSGNPLSIQNNIICDIYIDESQNVWLGHDVGLSMITRQAFYQLWPLGILTGQFGGNVIHAISQDKDGNVWMGGTDGLIRYRKDQLEAGADWYKQSGSRYRIQHNRVRAIYNDRDGDVWVITDNGINLYDKVTRELRNFIVEDADDRFSCRWAYDLYMDKQRNLWIAAYNEGMFVINKERLLASGGCCKADAFYGESNRQLSGQHVSFITQDEKGYIWVASNGGIDCVDSHSRRVKHISDQSASCMLSDHQQLIWIAFDGGIRCFDSDGKVVRDINFKENNRPVRFIKLIEVENRIWAFTQSDCRIIHPDGNISIFSLPNINARSAYYSSRDHQVLVGGMDNVMYLDSKIADRLEQEQCLVLAGLSVNGLGYIGDKAPTYLSQLTLKSDENNLEFCFTDIPDSRSIPVLYAYCLKGNNDQWLPLSADKKIIFNGLPHGNYELVVCSIDGMGNCLHEVYQLALTILPPWYLSVWIKFIYMLLTFLLVWGILRFYHVRKRLHEEEEKCQKILEQQEMRSHFFGHLSSELKKLLVHIIVPAEKLFDSTPSQQSKVLAEEMRHSATQINALIRQAFDLNNSKKSVTNLYIASIDVVRFCRGFILRFEERHPEFHTLDYGFQSVTTELYMMIDVVRFDSVFNILVNFLSRHTETGGKVQLYIQHTADLLLIDVKGSPIDIDSKYIDRLFERYQQTNGLINTGTNSELYLAREYIMATNGELKAEYSSEKKTMSFKIALSIEMAKLGTDSAEKVNKTQTEAKKNVKNRPAEDNDDFLSIVTTTIEKHMIDSDFNVTILQYELKMGDKMLYRRVKQLTGLSPVEYIRHIRMNRAALLLKEGKFSVSEVMYMVGFSNSSYFSKCFQSVYGVTPTKYKQRWNLSIEQ